MKLDVNASLWINGVSVLTELEQIPLDFLPLVMTVQLLEYCLTIMSFACTELSYKDLWFKNACVSHQLDCFCVFCIQHFIPSIHSDMHAVRHAYIHT